MSFARRTYWAIAISAVVLLIAGSAFGEILAPKFRVLYWSGGALDSLLYQPIRSGGNDAYICHNGGPDGIFCDSINYGREPKLALKEDWHWTRRSFIRFNTIVAEFDSLEACELWLYKFGTSTHANWVQAYLVEGAWDEMTITWLNAPEVNMSIASDRWTPPFPDWEGWLSLDIKPIYESWATGPNYGLQLRQQDFDSDDGQDFYSADYLFCSLSIDALEVAQETECDGEILVEICYEVSDPLVDSVFTALVVYDSTERIPATTIRETVPGYPSPNLGWVSPGRYCFYWDMGADYSGREGCDFTVKIGAHNSTASILTVTDSFHIPDAEGVAWDGEDLWVTRSWYVSPDDTQRVYRVDPVTHEIYPDSCVADELFAGYTADCVWHDDHLWIMGGGLSAQRAKLFKFDASTCTIVD
ncbi:MAG TPA: DNRLRE domain-containing protein, partial [candidate division Zixibacteria bacterium]|nr:DNRLRE domain-containing protein [candidate division Zixibacteria bacterium]